MCQLGCVSHAVGAHVSDGVVLTPRRSTVEAPLTPSLTTLILVLQPDTLPTAL